jgi:hypothetical protein
MPLRIFWSLTVRLSLRSPPVDCEHPRTTTLAIVGDNSPDRVALIQSNITAKIPKNPQDYFCDVRSCAHLLRDCSDVQSKLNDTNIL